MADQGTKRRAPSPDTAISGRQKQSRASAAYLHTEKGKETNRQKALHMVAVRDHEKMKKAIAESREKQWASNRWFPSDEELESEVRASNWHAVAWKYTMTMKTLEARLRHVSKKSTPGATMVQSTPKDLEFARDLHSMGFALKYLVCLHPDPILPEDLAGALRARYGIQTGSVQKSADSGHAAAVNGNCRGDWLTPEQVRHIVDKTSQERLVRVLMQQTSGMLSKTGTLDAWRTFIRSEVAGSWDPSLARRDGHWCPAEKRKSRASAAASSSSVVAEPAPALGADSSSAAAELDAPGVVFDHEPQSAEFGPGVVSDAELVAPTDDADYILTERFAPDTPTLMAMYHAKCKQTALLALELSLTPDVLCQLVDLGWKKRSGAAESIAELGDAAMLAAQYGYSAEFVSIFLKEPATQNAVFEAVLKKGIRAKRTHQGKAANIRAFARDRWLTSKEVAQLADLSSKRTVAALFFQQTAVVTADLRDEKRWALWLQFVHADCAGVPWIGESRAPHPGLLSPADAEAIYDMLVRRLSASAETEQLVSSSVAAASSSATDSSSPPATGAAQGASCGPAPEYEDCEIAPRERARPTHVRHRRLEIVAEIVKHFPSLELIDAKDDETWTKALTKGKNTVVKASCTRCGKQGERTLRLLRTGQSGICACVVPPLSTAVQCAEDEEEDLSGLVEQKPADLPPMPMKGTRDTDDESVRNALHRRYIIDKFYFQNTSNWKNPQNQLWAQTTCQVCGIVSNTLARSIQAGHSPACRCNGSIPWRSKDGYLHFCEIVSENGPRRGYSFSQSLGWWVANVVDSKTKVPISCTLCKKNTRDVAIGNVIVGFGSGCKCALHGQSSVGAWFATSFPDIDVKAEYPAVQSWESRRALRVDYAITKAESLASLWELLCPGDAAPAILPSLYIEVDGQHHFTMEYDGRKDMRYGRRDYEKEMHVLTTGATLIRLTQKTVMIGNQDWHRLLRSAMALAMRSAVPGSGAVLHQSWPCYCDPVKSHYAAMRSSPGSKIGPSELTSEPLLRLRRLR